ncbi:GTPase IMAP family member 8-like [Seriola lalandi dorsalis]|uniref:GTPase IMAP family member 8 n=1 Tax=Seriola lalandi dorsalis TaxID=1841481 RepID=A0A3B4X234_SERLL|nr:GTPase IMAP family member 8-like [Seriola lalandi dorsalis]
MSHKEKIPIFIVGADDLSKNDLITKIQGKDSSKLHLRNANDELEIYVNDTYEISILPDKDALKRHLDHPEPYSGSHPHQDRTGGSKKPKEERVNLVLLGMAGTGKSASGNKILGYEYFMSKPSSSQVTMECKEVEDEINSRPVRVIDTPDIFDDDIKPSVKDKHVKRCRELCRSDPCVYLLVIQVGRFTDGERDVLKKLEKAFGRNVHEQTILLFTRGEELPRAHMSLDNFLQSCQSELKHIVEKCDKRCVFFENKTPGSSQVEKLMQTVNSLIQKQSKAQLQPSSYTQPPYTQSPQSHGGSSRW